MRIGITLGDPAGVGPELVVRAVAADGGEGIVVYGDEGVLEAAAARAGVRPPSLFGAKVVAVTKLPQVTPGRPDPEGAKAQVAYLEAAVAGARRGDVDALCTAPIHKGQARAAGFAFPGHTEFLASRLGVRQVAMMLAGPHLRVVPVTTHVGIADVSRALSADGIARICALTVQSLLEDFAIAKPRVAVAGLNPHAGEGGLFGDEEARLIGPAVTAVAEGPLAERIDFSLTGPHVPDAIFRQAASPPHGEGRYDAVVAMYHDQGLIPLKLIDFEDAVNVTLGLPLPRTSPDHGVAYDAAEKGAVRDGSFRAALALARRLAERRALRKSNP